MIALLLVLSALTLPASPAIGHAQLEVRTGDGRLYSVRMKVFTTGDRWSAPSHTLERDAGSRVLGIHAALGDGSSLEMKLKSSGEVDRVIFTEPLPKDAAYELDYDVEVNPDRVARIPLAVPEIPVSGGARAVEIHVTPPEDSFLTGDAFPALARNTAALANFPSHLEIEVGKQARRWTPTRLSDLGVLLLLAAGTIGRVLLRRRGAHP